MRSIRLIGTEFSIPNAALFSPRGIYIRTRNHRVTLGKPFKWVIEKC